MDLARGTDTYNEMGQDEWVLSAILIATYLAIVGLIIYSSDHERRKLNEAIVEKEFDAIMLQGGRWGCFSLLRTIALSLLSVNYQLTK